MLLVVLLLGAGVALARLPSMPEQAPAALDVLVIWVALPALILREIPRIDLDAQALVPVAAAWGSLLVSAALVWGLGRALGWDRRVLGAMLVVVPLGNTSFLGLAAVDALLGSDHLGPALVYDQVGSFVGLATWGTVVAAGYGEGERPGVAATAHRVVTFPPFVALMVALGLRWVPLSPDAASGLDAVLEPIAALLVPLAMLTVGLRLSWPRGEGSRGPIACGLSVRLVLAPALVAVALWYGGWLEAGPDGAVGRASVLEAAMPPMVTAGVVATNAGLDEQVSAGLVGLGVLTALVTAPGWAWLVFALG